MLGEWGKSEKTINDLHLKFSMGKPFENVIINNFFCDEIANECFNMFPNPYIFDNSNWCYYKNPIENKYTLNKFDNHDLIKKIFSYLQTDNFLLIIKKITGIDNLETDEYLHGAGIHAYPNNGKLDIHLDYNIHPITGKERRVNLIIYLNKNWKKEYGGDIKLYDNEFNEYNKNEDVSMWNTGYLFRTSDISYHGLPTPIKCPENEFRKSLAIYYVSEPRENLTKRFKAEFFPQKNQKVNDNLKKLYEIRKTRLITNEDLKEYPNWEIDGNGFW